MLRVILSLLSLLVTFGCTPSIYQYSKQGAEEFVLDSYKIHEEFSILEREGCGVKKSSQNDENEIVGKIMVLGEVGTAQAILLEEGYISIREAVAIAGGISFSGDKRSIHVIRGGMANPKIYKLSWNHIIFLPNQSLLLIDGDTLYIPERALTKWNRLIHSLNFLGNCNPVPVPVPLPALSAIIFFR